MTVEQELELGTALLSGIESIIKAFTSAKTGAITPAQVTGAIDALKASLVANDTVADHALDAKFPPG